jgi:hypothetical protein
LIENRPVAACRNREHYSARNCSAKSDPRPMRLILFMLRGMVPIWKCLPFKARPATGLPLLIPCRQFPDETSAGLFP